MLIGISIIQEYMIHKESNIRPNKTWAVLKYTGYICLIVSFLMML